MLIEGEVADIGETTGGESGGDVRDRSKGVDQNQVGALADFERAGERIESHRPCRIEGDPFYRFMQGHMLLFH